MMILKYALVGLVLAGGVNTFAQNDVKTAEATTEVKKVKMKKTPAERADRKVSNLNEQLDLTADQQSKIEALTATMLQSVEKVKADKTTTDEVKKSQVKALKETYKSDLDAVLTEDQIAKMAEMKAEKKQLKQENKSTPEDRAAKQTAEMTEKLSLTPEQVEKVSVLNLKVENKIAVIKKDAAMTKEKKREFIKGNKKDHMSVMKTILTAEQLVSYEAWLAEKKATKKDTKAVD
jgi:hypothetical protein